MCGGLGELTGTPEKEKKGNSVKTMQKCEVCTQLLLYPRNLSVNLVFNVSSRIKIKYIDSNSTVMHIYSMEVNISSKERCQKFVTVITDFCLILFFILKNCTKSFIRLNFVIDNNVFPRLNV